MAAIFCILGALIYFSEFYLHRFIFLAVGILISTERQPIPTSAIWFLSALWPLVDVYLAIAISYGAYRARKE